jgi:O-methyltransferase
MRTVVVDRHTCRMLFRRLGLELRRVQVPSSVSSKPPVVDPGKSLVKKNLARSLHFQHLADLIEDVPGDIVECGVGAGKTLFVLGILSEGGTHVRRVWAFDSFQGLPAAGQEDEPERAPKRFRAGKLSTSEETVRTRLTSYGMPRKTLDRIAFVPGFFPHSFSTYAGGPIALLHLDVDLYQSYKDCLEFFEPMVVPGGVVAFDEYESSNWPGAKRAIDEYYGGRPPGIRRSPHWNRFYLVKSSAAEPARRDGAPPGFSESRVPAY